MLIAIFACVFAIIADQWTKFLAFAMEVPARTVTSFFTIQKAKNTGAAFGMLGKIEHSQLVLIPLSILTIVVLVFLIRANKKFSTMVKVPIGLIMGGALSNLYDRICFGYVKDFIFFHYKRFSWPIFNLADVFICVGVVILIISTFKHHPKAQPVAKQDEKPKEEIKCTISQ